jgi:16S rRNA (uracil1498-N3)-methyltransferase
MKRPARFSISSADIDGALALIGGAELHHMRNVMRLAPGAPVELFDESGAQYAGPIKKFDARHALVEIAGPIPVRAAPAGDLILAAAIIKGPRMDYLIEKTAELGVSEFLPLLTTRGVARDIGGERLARWRRVANAAAKQSLAPRPPAISSPLGVEDLIRRPMLGRLCIVLSAGAPPLGRMVREARARALLLICGPEGDFTGEERVALRSAGFAAAGLGTQRLRSETAALAALSIAAGALDELACEPDQSAEKIER